MSLGFRPKAVVYDLDGTLVDSEPDIAASMDASLAANNLPSLPGGFSPLLLHTGGRKVMRMALEKLGRKPDRDLVEKLFDDYISAYWANPTRHSKPYPGVVDALAALGRAGVAQGVCTKKYTDLSKLILERLGMLEHFGTVVGSDLPAAGKPDPEHMREVARRLGCEVAEIAYVGDTVTDLLLAKAAGVGCYIVVGWARDDAHEEGYSLRLGGYAELPGLLGLA